MKLHFEPNLDYQMQAIEAVCDLFRGQEVCRTEFTVTMKLPDEVQMSLGVAQSDLGVGNRLTLLDDELLKNLADIQLRGGLPPSGSLTSGDFTVEMETGTGKTYVYLRSIFELNKRYGFSKFVIVVPSVAIKEGVYKTLQITEEHFKGLYAGVPFDYFLYDSGKPGPVRNFATSSNIQIMVVTVGAINKKDVNNLYKETEKTGGEKPIDLIKATRPIIIVDEPQSVDGGLEGRGKEALDAMNPLCTLRYSATHVDKHHMVFRLDAVDAYERKLVKQIEVASATVEDAHNKPFVRLVKVENKRGRISAKVELDKQTATGVQRTEVTVSDGDDLQQSADGRAIYADFRVGEINTAKGEAFMELRYPGGEVFLQPGQAHGDVDALAVQREMIRRTIKEHLDKEKRNAVELAEAKIANELQKTSSAKDAEIQELKARLDAGEVARQLAVAEALSAVEKERDTLANELEQAKRDKQAVSKLAEVTLMSEVQKAAAAKESEIQELKAKLDAVVIEKKLAITEAVGAVEKERDELKSGLQRVELEKHLAEKSLKEKYETQIKDRDDAIERLRDMKARLSTKMVGETLEGVVSENGK